MPRSEYKYPGLRYDDCDLSHPRTKFYNRQQVHRETEEIIDEVYTDIVDYKHYMWGDITSLYGDLGPAFYDQDERPYYDEYSDKLLRELGLID